METFIAHAAAYLAAHGIWGVAGPVLVIAVAVITFTISEGRTVADRLFSAGTMAGVSSYVAYLIYVLSRIGAPI